jgi:predicted esterase
VSCQSDPTQTYTLYLPSSYSADRKWPALLIFDPRGRSVSAADLFRPAAEEYGWILISSNDTRSDGPMEPNIKAINALWPEIHLRYATDHDRIYLAGFSGGAMLAWQMGFRTGGVAGVLAAGGRFEPVSYEQKLTFPTFGGVGDLDFNYLEMRRVHEQLRKWGTQERLEVFPGPHSWMPEPLARQGIEWFERLAMRDGRREIDAEWLARQLASDMTEVRSRVTTLARWEGLSAILGSYEGLVDVEALRREAETLAGSPELDRERRDRDRWDAFEASYLTRLSTAYAEMMESVPPLQPAVFSRRLGVPELEVQSQREGYEGVVAKRLLETLFTQTSFYMMRDLFARGDFVRASNVLAVAAEVHPERGYIWYQLACAQARGGRKKAAIESLETAVERGFAQPELMATDTDLDSLRKDPRFQRLLAGVQPKP